MTLRGSVVKSVSTAKKAVRKARRGVQNPLEVLYSSPVARSVSVVLGANAVAGVAAAQSQASEAGDMLCSSDLGQLVGLGLGGAVVALLIYSAFEATWAFKNIGSGRSDKEQQGRQQAKSAGFSFAGAFVPGVFGVAMDKVGIGAFSCIDFGDIVGVVVLVPF